MSEDAPLYSLVIPIFNEQDVIPLLVSRLIELIGSLNERAEVIFVDDGSGDNSVALLRELMKADSRLRLIKLSRNFGHQIAITAGMEAARGSAVIVMDADLQDPPDVVPRLIEKWKEGYEIVYARRIRREGETWFKRISASLYYRILRSLTSVDIPRDVGDFRLVSKDVLDVFRKMPERNRFVRGMFGWIGLKQTAVDFERPPRAAGETKYPFWKMLQLAVHGVTSFSERPLRLALWLGFGVSLLAVLYGIFSVFFWLIGGNTVQGWTSTIVVISFLCGLNLFVTGILGLYVGNIHTEIKQRPLYVVQSRFGFETPLEEGKTDGASPPRGDDCYPALDPNAVPHSKSLNQ